MKKDDLIQALNEIDDDLLESVQRQRMNPVKKKLAIYRPLAGLIVTACAVAIVAVSIRRDPEPDGQEVITATPEPVEVTPDLNLKTIELSHDMQNTASAGFSIVMYPDLKKEKDYNPWNPDMDLKTLPVYTRVPSEAGIPIGLSEKEINANLDLYANYFNMKINERHDNTYNPSGKETDSSEEVIYSVTGFSDQGTITADGYGEILYSLPYNKGISLPDGIRLDRQASEEDARRAAEYLHNQYIDLFNSDEWAYDISGDYTFDGQKIRQYMIYETGENDGESILNYNFRNIEFAGSEDGSKLELIRIRNELSAYTFAGDYPLISLDDAYRELYAGNYLANVNRIAVTEDTEIADVQLVYLNYRNFEYVLPCYLFYADITDGVKAFMSGHPESLRSYGMYYVPAVSSDYLNWTDEPYRDPQPEETGKTPEPEIPQETAAPQPAETEEPVSAETPKGRSNSIYVSRYIQNESYYCSVACAQMILDRFGIMTDQYSLAKEMNTYKPGDRADGIIGTYDTDVARVLNDYLFNGQPQNSTDGGYRVQPVSETFVQSEFDQFVSRLEKNIDDGYPSIVQVRAGSLYTGGSPVNHNILVSGYKDNGSTVKFILMDPYFSGTEGNGVSTIEARALFTAIVESREPSYIW